MYSYHKACGLKTCFHSEYLIRWKGYSPAHDSWVNAEDMHVEELIKEFAEWPIDIRAGLTNSKSPSPTSSVLPNVMSENVFTFNLTLGPINTSPLPPPQVEDPPAIRPTSTPSF